MTGVQTCALPIYFTATPSSSGYLSSSPLVVNNICYVVSGNGNIYALNALNGSELWNYTVSQTGLSSPTIANGIIYIGSADGNVYGLRVSSPSPSTPAPSPLPPWSYTQLIEVTVLAAVIVVALIVLLTFRKRLRANPA